MKRWLLLCLLVACGSPDRAFSAAPCLNCNIHCTQPPPPGCTDCGPPCAKRHGHCSPKKSEKAHQLIDQLANGDCCGRTKAAKKLGCRLHADCCCDPGVLDALARALQCDPCWEVRREAAWSIAMQDARVPVGVLSLYIASKLDPHYLVRDKATDALGILLLCRESCFKNLLASADELIKRLRGKYRPGASSCVLLYDESTGALGCSVEEHGPHD